MISQIIFGLFVACVVVQLFYWLIIFGRLAFYTEKREEQSFNFPPLSIIICAYNEAENLKAYLPIILQQDYPDFEVLVVNDASTDASAEILKSYQEDYPHLKVLELQYPNGKNNIGKKNALSEGIRNATKDTLLLTDADCYPQSNQWAKNMVYTLKNEQQIGLGYGPYQKESSFLNAFVRYETVYTAIQYMSLSLWGLPYMGVGRNLIYQKKLFFQVDGFEKHAHIASGDDDLFINQVANEKNTSIVLNKESFMYSNPKSTWRAYFKQKSRHVTTGRYYKPIHQAILGMLSLSHFGLYFFALLVLLIGINSFASVLILISIILLKTIMFSLVTVKLDERNLIPLIPILDIIYVLYYVLLAPALLWGKTKKWK